ncbi:DUF1027 domain-containing protein [Rummeliibacillus sp. TYF005]|uniref:YutD family protein n=1 Tax=Rummeliibacillus sp. TYF005 TaxID=2058214 RepID=UPI000F54AD1B|nr:YutD family protein [Rummeliibacillus sp. TYF005]RPJ95497.1 DUF1027 domain-containing protein [Rummeliibacillus sp. TYF005]
MIIADQSMYEIIENVKEGFKQEDFNGRYSDILSKYDYIVGDWGYGQLRLKGFYEDKNQKATFDTRISTLQDYLYEYCNFGCPYFVLKKIGKAPQLVDSSKEMIEAVEEDIILIEETDTPQLDESNLENDLEQQKNIEQGQF